MTELKHARTYKYELGHVWFKAVTVGDLMAFLATFPEDMPVLTEWEGTIHSLAHPCVQPFEGSDALVFDVEYDVTE
jgi:hypothetical protein